MTFRKILPMAVFLPAVAAFAAPMLRLHAPVNGVLSPARGCAATFELRPVWIQTGTNGPTNISFETYNDGDGTLNPQVSGSHSWLTPAVDAARPCTFDAGKSCRPVRAVFNSASLAAGAYNGVITIADSGAVDTPQTVCVKAYVNGNVPARLEFYAPPDAGTEDSVAFQTPTGPAPAVTRSTQTGGNWLAVSSSGLGSFQFIHTHTIRATVQAGMAAGDYNGTMTVAASTFTADNRAVPAVLHVTAQPIARAGALGKFLAVAGGAAIDQNLALANGGRGTLTVSGAAAAGGAWLTAAVADGVVKVTANPASLSPGFYNGAVTVNTNAANGAVTVPVELEVQAVSGPLLGFGGVVDAASFLKPVGAGAIASLFGFQLAPQVALAETTPLPRTLGGVRVLVNDNDVPLFHVFPGQINFQMPFEASGVVRVQVERQGQRGNTISAQIARRGPGLLTFRDGYGIVVNDSRGGAFAWPDIPALAGAAKAAARPGDYLVMYGSGFGPVDPPVASGAASPSPASVVTELPQVVFGGGFAGSTTQVEPLFVGLTPFLVALFQVNVQVPPNLPANPRTQVRLNWPGGGGFSNTVAIAVERP